ncbi:PREDICTED: uncharacterized protein LOC109288343 [Gavialis gangeticus]|uniref:uncharacterized protein LOC109288343 n=1 Tax=Gavialis gangeticus TaxID=94835 RepID=UPI00092F2874|nr:PREDICTED: uncharacterized protein LOC109288343 [Gavialis gangeticus]
METISLDADWRNVLAYSIDAIRCLSDLNLSLEPALESCLLWAAMEKSFLATRHENHHNQVMNWLYEEYREGLLCCVLSVPPAWAKLYSIWEHFTSWIELPDAQHHALGMKIFTSIIAFAVQLLPQFEGSPDIPEVGDMAAHLGLSISNLVESISCKAREGVYWLAQILLHQSGQDIQGAEELWCKCQMQQRQVQNYRDLVRVGEGLRKILLEEQRISFLQRALHAVHNEHMHISQAGLVFLYATLGEARRLMGHKEKEIPVRVLNKLFAITCFKDLQGHSLLASSSGAPSSLQPPTLGPTGAVLSPLPLRNRDQWEGMGRLAALTQTCSLPCVGNSPLCPQRILS